MVDASLMEWRLLYPGVDFALGDCGTQRAPGQRGGYILEKPPEMGVRSFDDEDADLPQTDARFFGIDTILPPRLTFPAIAIRGDTVDETRRMRSRLSAVWRADAVRKRAGLLATIMAPSGRYAFGRPRRFAPNDADLLSHNVARAVADFEMDDERWFGELNMAVASMEQPTVGGIRKPITAPLTTQGRATGTLGGGEVGGELSTPMQVRIAGPFLAGSGLQVDTSGKTIRFILDRSLAYDEVMDIDTRPGFRTVTINGRPAGGALSPRSTQLVAAELEPGPVTLLLTGTSASGTAYAEVRWRDAFAAW